MEITSEFIREIVQQYANPLTLYARQFFVRCDLHVAEEVVQDVLLRLAQQEQLPENIPAWLYKSVRNRAISTARSEKRRERRERRENEQPVEPFFEPNLDYQLDADQISQKIAVLDVELREIVTLHLWGNLSFGEIAALLEKTKTTVFRRYEEGLETLRRLLGGSET